MGPDSDDKGEDNGLDSPNFVQDMDLEDDSIQERPILEESTGVVETVVTVEKVHKVDDSIQERPILEESTGVVETVVTVEKVHKVQHEEANDNSSSLPVSDIIANNLVVDKSPITGVKRARTAYVDQEPCVHVVYNSLTRDSKKKLMEVMQQWSEWHAQGNSPSTVPSNEALECGEEMYFPALHVGAEKTSTVSFWVDSQARQEDSQNMPLDNSSVPLYDRGYTLGSTYFGGTAGSERIETLEASRCFNCGSYSHSLKDCPKPRDNAAINSARKQHNSKRNTTPGSLGPVRYYQKSQGKFDDLKAGVLGPETRECLGIGEHDPPPWLHRMRELGYPPGYLDEVEDEDKPSGITIFGDEETTVEYEDGEIPEKGQPAPPEKKMTVEFPGINAPIPENADQRRWAQAAASSASFRNRSHHRPNRLQDSYRGQYSEHQKNDGPPGAEYGSGFGQGYRSSDPHRGRYPEHRRNDGFSSSYRLPDSHRDHYPDNQQNNGPSGVEHGSDSSYSPRYGTYDHNNPPPPLARSPDVGRPLSDRGWRSPARCEGSPLVQSPRSPHPSVSRQSPAHQHESPSASQEHCEHGSSYGSQHHTGRERQDHQHQFHHRQHHRN